MSTNPDTPEPLGDRPERRPPIVLDSVAIAHHISVTYGIRTQAATIRKWAQRGKITRIEREGRRNAFDLREVVAYARSSGWIPPYMLPRE